MKLHPSAVLMYQQALNSQPPHSVTVIVSGFNPEDIVLVEEFTPNIKPPRCESDEFLLIGAL